MGASYLSVNQAAERLNVSKQSIYNKLKNDWNGIKGHSMTIDGKTMIEEDFLLNMKEHNAGTDNSQVKQGNLEFLISELKTEKEFLIKQIEEKDRQLEKMQIILENEQKMRLLVQQDQEQEAQTEKKQGLFERIFRK